MRAIKTLLPAAAALLAGAFLLYAPVAPAEETAAEAPAEVVAEAPVEPTHAEVAPSEHSDVPELREPFPFDHSQHAKAFDKARVSCVDCHPVGAFSKPEGARVVPEGPIPGPRSSCHACHLKEIEAAPRKATGTCTTCHADRQALIPVDHGLDWVDQHGDHARSRGATCDTCHDSNTCVSCHESRGAMADKPHGPGWGAFHGVEARLDPRSCSSCHTGEACLTCHVEGVLPW